MGRALRVRAATAAWLDDPRGGRHHGEKQPLVGMIAAPMLAAHNYPLPMPLPLPNLTRRAAHDHIPTATSLLTATLPAHHHSTYTYPPPLHLYVPTTTP